MIACLQESTRVGLMITEYPTTCLSRYSGSKFSVKPGRYYKTRRWRKDIAMGDMYLSDFLSPVIISYLSAY